VGLVEWPTAVRNPVANLKVNSVKRSAPAGPVIGASPKVAKAGASQAVGISAPYRFTFIERLDGVFIIEATALKEADLGPLPYKFPGDRDACGPGTDDADIEFKRCVARYSF